MRTSRTPTPGLATSLSSPAAGAATTLAETGRVKVSAGVTILIDSERIPTARQATSTVRVRPTPLRGGGRGGGEGGGEGGKGT
jgi:hypothetical protein